MQGARRANIPAIFNRLGWAKLSWLRFADPGRSGDHRATPQDGMHRFPNADVFVGRDTRGLQRLEMRLSQRFRDCRVSPRSSARRLLAGRISSARNTVTDFDYQQREVILGRTTGSHMLPNASHNACHNG
jgi:hypothetical protein